MLTQDIINKLMLTETKRYKKEYVDSRNKQNYLNRDLIKELLELLVEV